MQFLFEITNISQVVSDGVDYDTIIFKIFLGKNIDKENSNDLWIFLNTLIKGGAVKIIVDMKSVGYIDSSGIGVFINIAKQLRQNSGDIVLSTVSPEVKNLFKVINLQDFIQIFSTDGEALNFYRYV